MDRISAFSPSIFESKSPHMPLLSSDSTLFLAVFHYMAGMMMSVPPKSGKALEAVPLI